MTAVIARHPCIRERQALKAQARHAVRVTEKCNGCGYCVREFECPALCIEDKQARIDRTLCIGCGVCIQMCPVKAITAEEK